MKKQYPRLNGWKEKQKMEKTFDKTLRGFSFWEFKDKYGMKCSIQKSSLATEDAIWFGVDDIQPKIMIPGQGWIPYEIPEEVSISSRMHLTQDQVRDILPILEHFVKTGDLPETEE